MSAPAQGFDDDDFYGTEDFYGKEVDGNTGVVDTSTAVAQPAAVGQKSRHGLDILCTLIYVSDHGVRELLINNLMCTRTATPLILPTLELLLFPY